MPSATSGKGNIKERVALRKQNEAVQRSGAAASSMASRSSESSSVVKGRAIAPSASAARQSRSPNRAGTRHSRDARPSAALTKSSVSGKGSTPKEALCVICQAKLKPKEGLQPRQGASSPSSPTNIGVSAVPGTYAPAVACETCGAESHGDCVSLIGGLGVNPACACGVGKPSDFPQDKFFELATRK